MLKKYFFLIILVTCLITATSALADNHNPKRIMPMDVMQKITNGDKLLILDYRTEAGVAADNRKIPGSIWVKNFDEVNKELQKISQNNLIITYCT